jgi:hypothetical protein
MKQANDTQTPDMLPDGLPVFELDHAYPWTLPPAKAFVPAPREPTLNERWKLTAARRLGA